MVALGALSLAVLLLIWVAFIRGGGASADDQLNAFLAEWSGGRDKAAAALTTNPGAATEGLEENRAGLDGAELTAEPIGEMAEIDGGSERWVKMTWEVPDIGPWSYETRITLTEGDEGWQVNWRPDLVYPDLGRHSRLGTIREAQARGRIMDRDGDALVTSRPVKRVGLIAGEVDDPRATARAFSDLLEVRAAPLANAIRGGGPQQFIEVITLRPGDYSAIEDEIAALPGVEVIDGTAQLAPTRAFARALLGEVRELTAEQLEELGEPYRAGDVGGQWGLQAQFEAQLAGVPRRAVVIRTQGVPTEELKSVEGEAGQNLETTLDREVQSAAEEALGETEEKAALVAIKPSTGDLLAVANRPIDDSFNRAMEGQYPPGSTFKIVTAAALLDAGIITPQTSVECPLTYNAGGRSFRNFEGGGGGSLSFASAFAQSCNTAFVSLAGKLAPDSLTRTATKFGLGAEGQPRAVPHFAGQVPRTRDAVSLASASIGQDRILASPLGMAGVIGTVAEGRWQAPRLLADDPSEAAEPLPQNVIDPLRDFTRQVVTSGTGTALAGIPGDVHGKSGTAEYGGGDPPPTHAWFVAYRGDLAVAVLVEGGEAGGKVAAPIAARFLEALGSA